MTEPLSRPAPQAAAVALEAIWKAFPRLPLAGDTAVALTDCWFDEAGRAHSYQGSESTEVARFFSRTSWWDIPGETLLQWRHASVGLRFLTPRARAYYLPTYMTAFLTVPLNPAAFATLESAIYILTASGVSGLTGAGLMIDRRTDAQKQAMDRQQRDSFQELVDSLDSARRAAVAAFLDAVEPLFEAPELGPNLVTRALNQLWHRCRLGD